MAAGQHRACNCRKNKKHVQQTATVIALTSWTDKRLRTWLNEFAAAQ